MKKHDGSKRPWLIAMPTAILVVVWGAWSGFWYWTTAAAQSAMTAWQTREAAAGRSYACGTTSFAGYPFRIEVDCAAPAVDDQRTALSIRAHNLSAVAQVWEPGHVIGEIAPPLTVGPLGAPPAVTMNWALAQASMGGSPGAPDRLSIVIDKPALAAASSGTPAAVAEHLEMHGRLAAGSSSEHPVLDLTLDLKDGTAPGLVPVLGTFAPLASTSADLAVVGVLTGLSGLTPKPLAQQLREIQAANGRLDITSARLQQDDLIASATGSLGLTPRGTLSGDLQLTVVNMQKLIPLLGLDRKIAQAVPQEALNRVAPTLDRLVPGLGNILRGGTPPAGGAAPAAAVSAGAAMLGGQPTQFEGKTAVTLSLRFDDGAAFLGPVKVGEVPPLY